MPEGRFDLVRGRLDLLGKRLTLTEGTVMLTATCSLLLCLLPRSRG